MIVKIIDMLGIPNIMCCCLITVMLLICTITDIKKREIWPVLTISCACLAVAGSLLLFHTYPWSGVVGGLVGFVPHILLAWKGKCGGGDALMMLAAGLCLGVFAVSLLMLIATILFFRLCGSSVKKSAAWRGAGHAVSIRAVCVCRMGVIGCGQFFHTIFVSCKKNGVF